MDYHMSQWPHLGSATVRVRFLNGHVISVLSSDRTPKGTTLPPQGVTVRADYLYSQ